MIVDLTAHIEFDADCYLYWIHSPTHTDMFSEGYIGMSSSPKNRLRQHNAILGNLDKAEKQGYSKDFIQAFHQENLTFEIINCGSRYEIQKQEYLLRSTERLGWNVAVGGSMNGVCARYKHGGTKNIPLYNKFVKLLNYCEENGIPVDSNFKTDSGFKLFEMHLQDDSFNLGSFPQMKASLRDESKGFVLGNFLLQPLSENAASDRWVFWDNRWWSKREAFEFNGVSETTVGKRLTKYKMTREEAVGFRDHLQSCFEIVILDGVECKYNKKLSKFSKEDLIELYNFYKTGDRGFKQFCKSKGVESANMLRYFKRYGLESKKDRRSKEFRQEVSKVSDD